MVVEDSLDKDLLQANDIYITEPAAEAIKNMLVQKNLGDDYGLRVYIQGGGCSGHQYGMVLENNSLSSDFVYNQHGIKVIVDSVSLSYLKGSIVDYVDDIMESGFKIDNPNATSSCGCGHSFRTDGAVSGQDGYSC